MITSIKEILSNVENLLEGTRAIKKFIHGASKAHSHLECDYIKLMNSLNIEKYQFITKLGSYKEYLNSFLKLNENIIKTTKNTYESLKRLIVELKSKLEILKIENKNIKRLKNEIDDEYSLEIKSRCDLLKKESLETTKKIIKKALDDHLYSLKSIKIGNLNMESDFSQELENSRVKYSVNLSQDSDSRNIKGIPSCLIDGERSKIVYNKISNRFMNPKES